MAKKTIAFVLGALTAGGAQRVVTTLSNELIKNYNITIITFEAVPAFYPLNQDIKVLHCMRTIPPSTNVIQSLWLNFKLLKRLVYFLKKNKVDLCVGFLTTSSILAIIASKINNIPVIVSERNNPYLEDNILPRFWKILRRITYPKANFLVVQTKTIENYYLKKIDKKRLVIIPNPLNPDFSDYEKTVQENIILNVGRLSDQKGQDLLINAFSKINSENWKLHIVGEGPKRDELQKLICLNKMQDRILLLGNSKNIMDHYRNSKIFAFTSLYEGFPNALIEAMHFGLACISTDCPSGPSELIQNEVNGFLIEVNNQKALKEKLTYLIKHEEERISFGKAAKITSNRFQVDKICSEWIRLFNKVESFNN